VENRHLIENPFGEFRKECEASLRKALVSLNPDYTSIPLQLEIPPTLEFGELASSICFELSKELRKSPPVLARELVQVIDVSQAKWVQRVEVGGSGYLNFYLNYSVGTEQILESANRLGDRYGFVKAKQPMRIMVEHTSVNPIHAIHIGQARNPALGDALARMLKARGHNVVRHYYIDDTGRQTAIIGYGFGKLGMPDVRGKPDHFIGQIYSITACLVQIQSLKKRIKALEEANVGNEDLQKLRTELDEWVSIAAELEGKYPDLFSRLLKEITGDADPDALVNELLQQYEKGEDKAKQLIRNVSRLCLRGFEQTLSRIGIEFDSWDWESDLIWSGRVAGVVDKLSRTPYVMKMNGTLELDAERIVEEFDLRSVLGVSSEYHIPSLTLTRSDGTTLYTTRDIAYSLWKFEMVERVVNVIGAEQTLAQLHLKIALCALGHKGFASNQRHFAYGLVELPGYKMSSRRGRFITFDEVIDEAVRRAEAEVSKRTPDLPEDQRKQIANTIAISAVKYALLSVEPARNVVFVWDKVLNFEINSAPFINYAYTRAVGILRKLGDLPLEIDYQLIDGALERRLVFEISRFPEIFCEAAENLRPDDVANYCNMLAEKFHEYYEKVDVIHVKDKALGYARGALVRAVKTVLRNGMAVLGMDLSERM